MLWVGAIGVGAGTRKPGNLPGFLGCFVFAVADSAATSSCDEHATQPQQGEGRGLGDEDVGDSELVEISP